MPKQTALDTINRLIAEENSSGATRQRTGDAVRTIDQLLAEEEEREQQRLQQTAYQKALNDYTSFAPMDIAKASQTALDSAKSRDNDWWQARRNEVSADASKQIAKASQEIINEKKEPEPVNLILPAPSVNRALNPALEAEYQRRANAEGTNVAPGAWVQNQMKQANDRQAQAQRNISRAPSGWKDVGLTVGGTVANFLSGSGSLVADIARLMEIPDDILYSITKNERFNLDRAPGLRDSEALRASDQFAEAAQNASDQVGKFGQQLISTGRAAGNMMAYSALLGNAFGQVANPGRMASLSNAASDGIAQIASKSSLITSAAGRAGAKIALDVLTNPGNVGISLGSAINSYSDAYANGATIGQALANGVGKGLAEYFSNKMFSGTPFEDAKDAQGYVSRLVEHIAKDTKWEELLKAFNTSTGGKAVNWAIDKIGEGLEEVITGLADPVVDKLTYKWDTDMATFDELTDEFFGGVLLSLLMSGGEALMNQVVTGGKADERRIADAFVSMGVKRNVANKFAKKVAEATTAVTETEGWLNGSYNGKAAELMRNQDYAEKSAGKAEVAAQAQDSDSESLQRYSGIFNRMDEAAKVLSGTSPSEVSETAWVNEQEARNYFYIWETQGAKAADAYYEQTVLPGVLNKKARAQEQFDQIQRQEAEKAAQQEAARTALQDIATAEETQPARDRRSELEAQIESVGQQAANIYEENGRYFDRNTGEEMAQDTLRDLSNQYRQLRQEYDNLETEVNNGQVEQQRTEAPVRAAESGTPLLGGGQGRVALRSLGKSAQKQAGQSGFVRQGQRAYDRRNRKGSARKVKVAELGLTGAREGAETLVFDRDQWDDDMRETADLVKRATGLDAVFVLGNIDLDDGGSIRGAFTGNSIIVQCDHPEYTVAQLAAHESYHALAASNPGLDEQVKAYIRSVAGGEAKLREITGRYIEKLGDVFGLSDDMTEAEYQAAKAAIEQEVLADAFAGMNVWGAGATQLSPEVRSAVNTNRQNAAATERTTGPPVPGRLTLPTNDSRTESEPKTGVESVEKYSLNTQTIDYAIKYVTRDEELKGQLSLIKNDIVELADIQNVITKALGKKASRNIHDLNDYLNENRKVWKRLWDIQQELIDNGIQCDFVTKPGTKNEIDGKKVPGGLKGLPIEYVASDTGKRFKFTAFWRNIPQMLLDSMTHDSRERIRTAIMHGVEDAYARKTGETDLLPYFKDQFPKKGEMNKVIGEKKLKNIRNQTQKRVQPPIRDAEKTVGALNLNSACPMFTIGNNGCYLDACYLTQMANGATGTNLFRSAWYTGELLQIAQSDIELMNELGGLRVNGVGDTTLDNKSQIKDALRHAGMRGLKVKIITKQRATLEVLKEMHDAGEDVSHITVQPSMDNLWIPAKLDDAYGAGVRGNTQLAQTVKAGRNEAAAVAYDEMFGRATKVMDGVLYRKYGFTAEQIREMQEDFPFVNITPRYVVCTAAEIAEIALNRDGQYVNGGKTIQTLMHGKVPSGCVSDYPGELINFGGARHVVERKDGKWHFFGEYISKGKDGKGKVGKIIDGPKTPYGKVQSYIEKNYTKAEQDKIWLTLKNQMCCQANDFKDACAGCQSLCARGCGAFSAEDFDYRKYSQKEKAKAMETGAGEMDAGSGLTLPTAEKYSRDNIQNSPADKAGKAGATPAQVAANEKYSREINALTYFSGGGLVDYAMRDVIGSGMAVEFDKGAAAVYALNNGKVYVGDVRNFSKTELAKIDGVEYFHASPVCKNYSRMNIRRSQLSDGNTDITTAQATADAIRGLDSLKVFTLEQVPEYDGSDALKIITDALDEMGFVWDKTVANAHDYGGATSRERLMLRAVKDGKLPPLPAKVKGYSWFEATADLITGLEAKDRLSPFMQERIDRTPELVAALKNQTEPILLLGGTPGGKAWWSPASDPCPSITTDMQDARILMPDGTIRKPNPRFFARIMGLPDSYKFSQWRNKDNATQGYKVIGNGVPVQLTQKFFGNLLDDALNTGVKYSREIDAEYMSAAESGDMETAQRMVDEAAKKAGYRVEKYHGTKANFNTFDPDYARYGGSGYGYYFGDKEIAEEFGADDYGEDGNVLRVLINDKNIGTIKTHNITADGFESALESLGLSPEKTYKYHGADTAAEYVKAHHDYRLATDLQYWASIPRKYAENPSAKEMPPRKILAILQNNLGLDGIRKDSFGQELVLWDNHLMKLADPVTYDDDGNIIPLSQRFNPKSNDIRYSTEEEEYTPQSAAEYDQLKKAGKIKAEKEKVKKPVAKSKATIAKKDLRNTLIASFSIPDGFKADIGKMIDGIADRIIRDGRVSYQDQEELFDKLYSTGEMTIPADDTFASVRNELVGSKIYVPEAVKHEFGEDWADIRKEAFSHGIYFTNNPDDMAVDVWNSDVLAFTFPGVFNENAHPHEVIERLLSVARAGKAEKMSLPEYAAKMVGAEFATEDDMMTNLERQLDWALRTFADKAGLEIYLKDRTGVKLAEEREKFGRELDRRTAAEIARRAKERDKLKESAQKAREQKAMRELQQKTLKQLQWLNKNRYKFSGDMKAEVDKLLEDIDTYAISAANELHLDKKRNMTWRDIRDLYLEAKESDPNFLPSKELERIVARLDYKKIGDLDVGALQDLYKAAVGLRTELYNRNNLIADELHQTFQEVYDAAKDEINEAPGSYNTGGKGFWNKYWNDAQLTPMNRLQRMAGWNPDSRWYGMAKMLEQGERAQRRFKTESARQLAPVLEQYKDWVKTADGQGKNAVWYKYEVPESWEYRMGDKPVFSDKTVTVWMTPAQKVHMYLESKNYDNLRHMEGGRTFANKELYSKGERTEAFAQGTTVRLLPETVKAMVSDLTPEEQALADALEKYYNGFSKDEINRVSNLLYGYDKAMEASYAPIYTNNNYTKSEPGNFDVTAEGVGNLKSRVVSSNPSLNIGAFDAFEKSVDKTSKFVGLAIPVQNMNTLMNWREKGNSMKDIIDHKWGEKETKWIEDLLTELQSGNDYKRGSVEKLTNAVLSKYISAVFGANPSIVAKQFASYPLAATYLGWENMPKFVPTAAQVDTDLMARYTGELDYRLLGYATPETATLKDNPSKLQQKGPLNFLLGGGAITWMDGFTVRTLWTWAENKVKREQPDLERGTQGQIDAGESEYYKAVAKEFEEAVSRSQPMYDVMHRSNIMRESNPVTRALTLFKTVPQQELNMLRQAIGEAEYYKRTKADADTLSESRTKVGRAALGVITGNLMIGLITFLNALWKNRAKRYRDEDGELNAESVIGAALKQYVKDSAGLVVGGGEAADLLSAILLGDKWYGLEMPGIEQIGSILEQTVDAGTMVKDIVQGSIDVLSNGGDWGQYMADNSEKYLAAVDKAVSSIGTYATGLPMDNLKAYLLGTVTSIFPQIQTAYEDATKQAVKGGLKGLTGASLEVRAKHILQDRAGKVERETIEALTALYEAGYDKVIPSAQQKSLTVKGEERELNVAQQQIYKNIWKETVGGALDELVNSKAFQDADDKTQAKMIEKLYDVAAEKAKGVLFDDYESTTENKLDAMQNAGASVADYAATTGATADAKRADSYETILASDMSDEAKLAAIGNIIGTDMTTDSGNPTQWARLNTAVKDGMSVDDAMDLMQNELLDDYDRWRSSDAKKAGIGWNIYKSYKTDTSAMKADKDANGKSISGSKKAKVLDYINRMNITKSQKDTLYYDAGYTESGLKDTPWHQGGGSGSGNYARLTLPTAKKPWEVADDMELRSMNDYGGNVDLTNRKSIPITQANIDTVHGWNNMDDARIGDRMTVASQTYNDGDTAIVVTPILPDGTLMTQRELDRYMDSIIRSGDYANADKRGIILGVFDDGDWNENLAASDEFANRLHELHERKTERRSGLRLPEAPKVTKPSSGLRLPATNAAPRQPSGLRLK